MALDETNIINVFCVKGCSDNMSGPRPQDVIHWGRFRHKPDPCPACKHCFMQTIESSTNVSEQNASINAENEEK
eukprot:3141844-Ditylum_brightwellii.AAC.1